jgi:hypothetical protein
MDTEAGYLHDQHFLKPMMEIPRNEPLEPSKRPKPGAESIEDAREAIEEFLANQEYPKVTVARKYLKQILEKGLRPHPTAYQKNVRAIVGTLGVDPLLPKDEDRVILELRVDPKFIDPRFTGPNKTFQGVVGISMPAVPPEMINVIDPGEAA